MSRKPRKILIIAETVTAAHAIRCLDLTRALDPAEIHFAARDLPENLRALFPWLRFEPLRTSLTPAEFATALRAGRIGLDAARLEAQIAEDLGLLRSIRPDEVIGDFRLSLAVSARLAGVRHINLVNAFWHPDAPAPMHAPCVPQIRAAGRALGDPIFRLFRPLFLNSPLRTLNPVLSRHGVPPAASLQELYSSGDTLLHPDPESFFPGWRDARSRFIGPLTWTPPLALPSWWARVRSDRPTVYFSMGSSGSVEHSDQLVRGLAGLGLQVLWAAGGALPDEEVRDNIYRAPYLPLPEVAKLAHAAVLNGGSAQGYFFLRHKIPFVGVPDNLDQFLFMETLTRAGLTSFAPMIPSDQVARKGLLASRLMELVQGPAVAPPAL